MTAVHLAAAVHAQGKELTLVDGDPQGSALAWCERAGSPWLTVAMATKTIHQRIDQLARGGSVIIDTPPGDLGIIASALRACEVAVIPCQPTASDVSQIAETRALVEDVAAINDIKAVILLTRVVRRTIAATETRTLLTDAGLHVLHADVAQSQALALAYGEPVTPGVYADVLAEIEAL